MNQTNKQDILMDRLMLSFSFGLCVSTTYIGLKALMLLNTVNL